MPAEIVPIPTKPRRKRGAPSKPLTVAQCRALKAGQTLSDTGPHRGLRLVGNQDGSATWIYRYRNGKRLSQVRIGAYPDTGLQDARSEVIRLKELRKAGADPQLEVRRQREALRKAAEQETRSADATYRVRDLVQDYLTEIDRRRSPKAAKEARKLLERHAKPIELVALSELTPRMVAEHLQAIAGQGIAYTARQVRSELRAAWQHALDSGLTVLANPITPKTGGTLANGAKNATGPKATPGKAIPRQVLGKSLLWVRTALSPATAAAWELTLRTGLRQTEVTRLRKGWILEDTPEALWLLIPAQYMKKPELGDQLLPLVGTAREIAEKRWREHGEDMLFPGGSKDGHLGQRAINWEINTKYKKTRPDIPYFKARDPRHTVATELAALGCPSDARNAIQHRRQDGSEHFYNAYSYKAERLEWLTRLNEHIDALIAEAQD